MEINLNNNLGVSRDVAGTRPLDAEFATKTVAETGADQMVRDAVTITSAPAGLVSAEPVAHVPADALVRDDALGRLVGEAFSLPPPPMPPFVD